MPLQAGLFRERLISISQHLGYLSGCQTHAGGFLQAIWTGNMAMLPSLRSCYSLLLCRQIARGLWEAISKGL